MPLARHSCESELNFFYYLVLSHVKICSKNDIFFGTVDISICEL